jgi:tRNA modification GTPase
MFIDDNNVETIAACATPPGYGGVGIIRVSGPLTKKIAQEILGRSLQPRYAINSNFLAADKTVIDQGIALYFPSPHSFTGEDILELHGHGGPVVLDYILQRVLELGARLAKPGEFSERAFLHGKIDLTQAEAIADLINASSTRAAQYAVRSLQGEFSQLIHNLVKKITDVRVAIEATIDFAEEEIDFVSANKVQIQLKNILDVLQKTKVAAEQGVLVQEGISTVIVGKPNVGKSSLLNCLSGEDVAIVTEIPGTTRDVVRTHIKLDGINLQLIDTAGLRDSDDIVEKEGVRRALLELDKAQYILLVVDAKNASEKTPRQLLNEYFDRQNTNTTKKIYTIIYNKIDLINKQPSIIEQDGITCVFISAKAGHGIDLLRQQLKKTCSTTQTIDGGFSARRRHLVSLAHAEQHLL